MQIWDLYIPRQQKIILIFIKLQRTPVNNFHQSGQHSYRVSMYNFSPVLLTHNPNNSPLRLKITPSRGEFQTNKPS